MNRQSNKITALYCRLAHYKKDFDIHIAQNQQEILLQYVIDHGLENPCFYCDWGFSGATFDRPEFRSMFREIKAGNVSHLVVRNLSRLGRDSFACMELLEATLPEYGVTFHSVQDGITTPEQLPKMAQLNKALHSLCYKSRRGGRA